MRNWQSHFYRDFFLQSIDEHNSCSREQQRDDIHGKRKQKKKNFVQKLSISSSSSEPSWDWWIVKKIRIYRDWKKRKKIETFRMWQTFQIKGAQTGWSVKWRKFYVCNYHSRLVDKESKQKFVDKSIFLGKSFTKRLTPISHAFSRWHFAF